VLAQESSPRPTQRLRRAVPRFDGGKVLLVEDNLVNQQVAREMLRATGLRIDVADNGRIALEKLFAAGPHAYDLVLMDIQMPEMGGHAATRRIRMEAQYAGLPIVAMTAHANAEEREQCMQSGMQDHIAKPVDPDQLYQILTRWLKQTTSDRDGDTAASPAAGAAQIDDDKPIEIAGFDTADTLDRLDGDVDFYHRILETLLPSLATARTQLNGAIESGDRMAMQATVHGIRGMAANVGAVALAASAARLEAALQADRPSAVQLAEFHTIVDQTLRMVEQGLALRKPGLPS
jgi:two-component system sensor histidine kinase/response regulator